MKISACVIVKNEENNIKKWLESMEKLAEEIIVVDTGSTDNTEAIVKNSQAKLYHFSWINDFSAAKNFALDKATGDWIVFLDADEYFRLDDVPKVKRCILGLHKRKKLAGIMCRLINIDVNHNNRFIGSAVQMRLFRNKSWLRYQGCIHEALTVPKEYVVELVDDIEIYHTGYSETVIKDKLHRNLELLKNKIKSQHDKKTPMDYRYLMDCYYGLADYEQGLKYAKASLDNIKALQHCKDHIYIIYISCHIFGKQGYEETLRAFAEAEKACKDVPDFLLMEGLYLHDQENYLASAEKLQQGLTLSREAQAVNLTNVAANKLRFLPNAYRVMGKYYRWRQQQDKALEMALEGLKIYIYHEGLLTDLVQGLLDCGYGDADIIELLNSLYNVKEDSTFLVKALSRSQFRGIYFYYARKAGAMSAVKTFQMAGRWDAAALSTALDIECIYNVGIAAALQLGQEPAGAFCVLLPPHYQAVWRQLAEKTAPQTVSQVKRQRAIRRMLEQ